MAQKISQNLHKISDKLGNKANENLNAESEKNQSSVITNIDNKILKKALLERIKECNRARADMKTRLISKTSSIPEKIKTLQYESEKLKEILQKIELLLQKINQIDDIDDLKNTDTKMIAQRSRKIEAVRLEYVQIEAQMNNLFQNQSGISPESSKTYDFGKLASSVSFIQLLKIGFFIFLPLVLALILTAVIISAGFFFSMGGF